MDLHQVVPSRNEKGAPVFCVLVKRTYAIAGRGAVTRCEPPRPFLEVDEYWDGGDPTWSTVKFENELAPYKLATDVVVVGTAQSVNGQPVSQMDASVEVGRFTKTIRVIGDRHCHFRSGQPPVFSEPAPFIGMEVRYDRAYGGKDDRSVPPVEFYYPRNTMGVGLAVRNVKEVVDGLRLPNLEDPNDLLTPDNIILGELDRWNQQPLPQGFGWFQKTWYPRCSFVGSIPGYVDVDEVMREELLHWVPKRQIALARQFRLPGFDVRFNNGGSWGLIVPFLDGHERITLSGLSKAGVLTFELPGEAPTLTLDIGFGAQGLETVLHTVLVRVDDEEVDLIWRGALEYPGVDWLPEMPRLQVEVR
jgi:hypothetical protein